jgi:hypothetical protein
MTSSSATMTLSTRPKIHRLPAMAKPPKKFTLPPGVMTAAIVLIIAGTGIGLSRQSVEATTAKAAAIPEEVKIAPEIKDPGANSPHTPSSTIVIKDKNEGIVGQMAKIPSPNVQITEIQAVSNVDKASGRELLSIVNKY